VICDPVEHGVAGSVQVRPENETELEASIMFELVLSSVSAVHENEAATE
jgi:hypothetical protein